MLKIFNNLDDKSFFWTRHQWDLIEHDRYRVLFTSEFGTGKTILLKAKAKRIANQRANYIQVKKRVEKDIDKRKDEMLIEKDPGKTFFILFTSPDSLLTLSVQREFLALKDDVEVRSYFSRSETDLIKLVEENSRCQFHQHLTHNY